MSVSDIVIESSLHGRERRVQRDISKRDLQAAVKYGTRTEGRPRRNGEKTWLYEFADITYVTDFTSTREITAWGNEIQIAELPVSDYAKDQHDEARRRIQEDKSIITSHYVFVVDMSASMRDSDMNGHRSRFRCVYYSLAETFVLDAIEKNRTFCGTDVVTLIEMHGDVTIVFEREPISMVLYNRFIQLALRPKEHAAFGHGNFLPSLKKAVSIHLDQISTTCASSVFFLTDGKPSDPTTDRSGVYRNVQPADKFKHFTKILCSKMSSLFMKLKGTLSFNACGFGGGDFDFDVLRELVAEAKKWGVNATFINGSVGALSTSLTSLVSSTTETRTMLSRLSFSTVDRDTTRVRNSAQRMQAARASAAADSFDSKDWRVYFNDGPTTQGQIDDPTQGLLQVERYLVDYVKRDEKVRRNDRDRYDASYKRIPLQSDSTCGIAVHKEYFGEGAERVVFFMRELNGQKKPVGMPLVAKESKWALEKEKEKESFHFSFAKTQRTAANLARKFCSKLDLMGIDRQRVPRIEFLDCSIYYCNHGEAEYLVERQLNHKNYVKWNDNAGGVDGRKRIEEGPRVHFEIPERGGEQLECVVEDDEEDEDSDDDSDDEEEEGTFSNVGQLDPLIDALQKNVLCGDVPQAFSHWTYAFTKRKKLVCDLQGELVKEEGRPPLFMMTDPCTHIADPCRPKRRDHNNRRHDGSSKRKDSTDRGKDGMDKFFISHKCNALCKILGLSHTSDKKSNERTKSAYHRK